MDVHRGVRGAAILVLGLIITLMAGCDSAPESRGSTPPELPDTRSETASAAASDTIAARASRRARLGAVRSWLYLIDVNLDAKTVEQIAASDYDMVVLDFIPSEKENTGYPMRETVQRLHGAPVPKLVLAYLDIGEAESYRTYWQEGWRPGNPSWILGADPDGWEENYVVEYWREEWKQIWLGPNGLLAKVTAAGFDGIYLDWVEGYSDETVSVAGSAAGIDPAEAMIRFVRDLAGQARSANPGALVIGQNAAELAATRADYAATIDATSQEQTWFDGGADGDPPGDCPLPATRADVESDPYRASLRGGCARLYEEFDDSTLHMSSEEYVESLDRLHASGMPVFTVDYATDPANVERVLIESRSRGFVPFVSTRALDAYVEPR